MVEIHSSGFSPCHDLVVWWSTPDLKMMNQDIWFLQGCTLIEKICFQLNHQQTRWLTSRHSGLLSNQKFPFVKNKSVKMFMPVWMTFLDTALWWLLTLASLPITPPSVWSVTPVMAAWLARSCTDLWDLSCFPIAWDALLESINGRPGHGHQTQQPEPVWNTPLQGQASPLTAKKMLRELSGGGDRKCPIRSLLAA